MYHMARRLSEASWLSAYCITWHWIRVYAFSELRQPSSLWSGFSPLLILVKLNRISHLMIDGMGCVRKRCEIKGSLKASALLAVGYDLYRSLWFDFGRIALKSKPSFSLQSSLTSFGLCNLVQCGILDLHNPCPFIICYWKPSSILLMWHIVTTMRRWNGMKEPIVYEFSTQY